MNFKNSLIVRDSLCDTIPLIIWGPKDGLVEIEKYFRYGSIIEIIKPFVNYKNSNSSADSFLPFTNRFKMK
ncbi:hypothetical protein HZS_7689 [Henneguya salminicola]|nr:hypothetical protein HZS_7689 [Henneguya salminicola]